MHEESKQMMDASFKKLSLEELQAKPTSTVNEVADDGFSIFKDISKLKR